MNFLWIPLVLVLPSLGCTGVTIESGCSDMDYAIPVIKAEVARRFPDAHVYVCHGGESEYGWIIAPNEDRGCRITVQEKANELRERYPDRPIVFWTCNDSGDRIKGKGIYYFKTTAWTVPDAAIPYTYKQMNPINPMSPYATQFRQDLKPNEEWAGSIEEAIEGD